MARDSDALTAAGLTGGGVQAMPVRDLLAPLAEQAATGTPRIDVGQILPFEQALDGLATIASGAARGKLVVTSRTDHFEGEAVPLAALGLVLLMIGAVVTHARRKETR